MGNGRGFWGFSQLGGQEEAAALWQTALRPFTTILTSGPWFQRGSGISEGLVVGGIRVQVFLLL